MGIDDDQETDELPASAPLPGNESNSAIVQGADTSYIGAVLAPVLLPLVVPVAVAGQTLMISSCSACDELLFEIAALVFVVGLMMLLLLALFRRRLRIWWTDISVTLLLLFLALFVAPAIEDAVWEAYCSLVCPGMSLAAAPRVEARLAVVSALPWVIYLGGAMIWLLRRILLARRRRTVRAVMERDLHTQA